MTSNLPDPWPTEVPHLSHPTTQVATTPVPLRLRAARGYVLELDDGRRLIDAISSWSRVPGSWPMRCWILAHQQNQKHPVAAAPSRASAGP
jgi:hypothetical protein